MIARIWPTGTVTEIGPEWAPDLAEWVALTREIASDLQSYGKWFGPYGWRVWIDWESPPTVWVGRELPG